MLRGEPELRFPPIRMVMDCPTEKLDKESRVAYSKFVTVEYSVKIFSIGRVVPEDFEIVEEAVNICWNEKRRKVKKTTEGTTQW